MAFSNIGPEDTHGGPADPEVEPAPDTQPVEPSEFERAFAEVESEILAVPEEHLIHITLDVRHAAVDTIARLPRIQSLRDDFVEQLPGFDLDAIDRLGSYALAAAQAYFVHQMSAAAPVELAGLARRVTERRSVLLADVRALVAHGLIDGAPLAGLEGANGYRNAAYDLLLLRNMLIEAWPRISGKTVLSTEELDEDAAVASRLLMAVGAKSLRPLEPSETARVRDQAFALFVRKYDQVRRAVAFVRGERRDADEYAPSLYAGRNSRRLGQTVSDAATVTPVSGAVAASAVPAAAGAAEMSAGLAAPSPFVA